MKKIIRVLENKITFENNRNIVMEKKYEDIDEILFKIFEILDENEVKGKISISIENSSQDKIEENLYKGLFSFEEELNIEIEKIFFKGKEYYRKTKNKKVLVYIGLVILIFIIFRIYLYEKIKESNYMLGEKNRNKILLEKELKEEYKILNANKLEKEYKNKIILNRDFFLINKKISAFSERIYLKRIEYFQETIEIEGTTFDKVEIYKYLKRIKNKKTEINIEWIKYERGEYKFLLEIKK
ncbi:hypothetical protein SAMN02745174_02335 [Cetobacterium ceti]|uniref:Fimbrial assembly protein (PilN) n=1 Tax=Cetobacterium ceti TaxID=180163 RepID=A0A1T4QI14_9FUSO|nr:hypothetical protein [Cetobacterium ceti]SKA03433.1 hypothetical protein SAMN02745174_02335 [Cetobacterium ceti]